MAAKLVTNGHVRLNGTRVTTPAHGVRGGDVLTLSLTRSVVVLTVSGFASRRGPAAAAVRLYRLQGDPAGSVDCGRAG